MKTLRALLLLVLAASATSTTNAGSVVTSTIIDNTLRAAVACANWRPSGICFWLRCGFSGCRIRTTLKVSHYNPDLVVSAYNELGGNPWQEIRATLGTAQRSAVNGLLGSMIRAPLGSAGNRTEGTTAARDHKNMLFRETDAVGHPLASLSGLLGYVCPSATVSLFPYFQSGLDALAWRTEVPEIFYAASSIPGQREIGNWPANTWGGVFPRTGWTVQTDEPKAAAINSQRAGDIITRSGQPHIYVTIPTGTHTTRGMRTWRPGPLKENDPRTGTWQMLVPVSQPSCEVFGVNDVFNFTGWGGGKVDPEGDYVFNLWRPYSCCRDRGRYLFSIDF